MESTYRLRLHYDDTILIVKVKIVQIFSVIVVLNVLPFSWDKVVLVNVSQFLNPSLVC